ncbi:MAG: hypothetical protein HYU97_06710 [Deltaproteobacteria bacterium]|nr:hypothetical protein [Deltaproteobacteria bacterium]
MGEPTNPRGAFNVCLAPPQPPSPPRSPDHSDIAARARPYGFNAGFETRFIAPEANWIPPKIYGNGLTLGAFYRIETSYNTLLALELDYAHLWLRHGFSMIDAFGESGESGAMDIGAFSVYHVVKFTDIAGIDVGGRVEVAHLSLEDLLPPGGSLKDIQNLNDTGAHLLASGRLALWEDALVVAVAAGVGFYGDGHQTFVGLLSINANPFGIHDALKD